MCGSCVAILGVITQSFNRVIYSAVSPAHFFFVKGEVDRVIFK